MYKHARPIVSLCFSSGFVRTMVWRHCFTTSRSQNSLMAGGIDWGEAADALMPLGEFWAPWIRQHCQLDMGVPICTFLQHHRFRTFEVRLFDWYIAFCSFAVLNASQFAISFFICLVFDWRTDTRQAYASPITGLRISVGNICTWVLLAVSVMGSMSGRCS